MQKKKIIVLGAGISGLTAAYELSKQKDLFDIQVIEKSSITGGVIDADTSTGYFFERGPRIFKQSPSFSKLISELDMEKEVIFTQAKGRYLWTHQTLRKMPPFSWHLLRGILKELWVKPVEHDETVWDFACRRFNPWVAEHVFAPMVLGIYAADSRDISVKAGLPFLKTLENQYGSLIKGLFKRKSNNRLFNFSRGMKSLVQNLEEKVNAEFHFGEEVKAIQKKESGYEIQTDKAIYTADYLFSALPCPVIGRLLLPELLKIPMKGTVLVHLGYDKKVLKKRGVGYLVSQTENEDLLGVLFDSNMFSQFNLRGDETRLTVLLKKENVSDTEARQLALKGLKTHLGITESPSVSLVVRKSQVFPQFKMGHLELVQNVENSIREKYPHLYLLGNYLYGAGVSDCIARAQSATENFLKTVAN